MAGWHRHTSRSDWFAGSHRLYSKRRVLGAWAACSPLPFLLMHASAVFLPHRRTQHDTSPPLGVAPDSRMPEPDRGFPRSTVLGICISFPKGIGVS